MNELLRRTLSGAVYVALIIVSGLLGPMVFGALTIVMVLLAVRELYRLLNNEYDIFGIVVTGIGSMALYASMFAFWYRYISVLTALTIIILGACTFALLLFSSNRHKGLKLLNHSVSWIVLPLFFLTALLDPFRSGQSDAGILLGVFVFVWVSDTFAYLTGKLLGKTPLLPSVSPKKTWEGLAGGFIFTLIAAVVWAGYFPVFSTLQWVSLAITTAVAGSTGDLYESYLKRKAGLKDAGYLIPGHGGVLDRLDSILFAAPAAFIVIILFFAK